MEDPQHLAVKRPKVDEAPCKVCLVEDEFNVVDEGVPLFVRLFSWFKLVKVWAALRADDTKGINPKHLRISCQVSQSPELEFYLEIPLPDGGTLLKSLRKKDEAIEPQPLLLLSALLAAVLALFGKRPSLGSLGPRRRALLGLLAAVLALPKWRAALLRAVSLTNRSAE